MKALVKEREAPGLSFMDVPEPGHARQEVLVRVKRAGICGTDLHIFDWDVWAQRTIPLGLTIGHEFVGEVVDVGADVSDVEIGDIVGAEGHLVCGRCRNCKAGRRLPRYRRPSPRRVRRVRRATRREPVASSA